MRHLPFAATVAAAIFTTAAHAAAPMVHDAWARLPAVPGRPAAAYFTVMGMGTADRLVEVSSPLATRTEMHTMTMTNGVMKMTPIAGIDIPARGNVSFAPGGNHAMLYTLMPAAKAGQPLPLALRFEKAGTVLVNAKAIAAGDPAPTADTSKHGAH
ncbi:MAG: copper chaperone PCu(A)C [Polymorphobacter sp.]